MFVVVGFGFVTFESEDDVEKLCAEQFVSFKDKRVSCIPGISLVYVACTYVVNSLVLGVF